MYKYTSISLGTLVVTPMGILKGKCDSCDQADCPFTVEKMTVSIFGINEQMECMINGHGEPVLVVDCEGYTPTPEMKKKLRKLAAENPAE